MSHTTAAPSGLSGLRILLCEDESLVALMLEDLLADLGCTVVASIDRLDAALATAKDAALDVAILDVNLAGKEIFPVAEMLQGRDVPFVFATGYGSSGLPEHWRDRPTVQKPFRTSELEQALFQATGRSPG
ncbi:response regulator [Zavarzinia sp. CC-PAN008]|uniref:response regulator n=1 Tax=Zavarzinia sp. CC-PAN008 TaxID=3243332 RepID=UPI003F748CBF